MSNPEPHSVSLWLEELKQGNREAAEPLWNRYYQRLIGLAVRKLPDRVRRVVGEEDVAAETLESCLSGIEAGRFPQLCDRQGLWQLLVTIAERKSINHLRGHAAQKRGSGNVRGESAFLTPNAEGRKFGLGDFADPDPTPAEAVCVTESMDELLGMLDDDQRTVAQLKLEGYTNNEIAEKTGRVVATVERRLRVIREKWKTRLESTSA